MNTRIAFFLLLTCLSSLAYPREPVRVEIRNALEGNEDSGFQLFRGDMPYFIRGAGTQNVSDLPGLTRRGGNSVRTWSTDNAGELLDKAHELGLTVALCIDVKRERLGFDYDDDDAVRSQLEFAESEVRKYRHHPALLFWIAGNELNLEYSNPRVYNAINDIALMIKRVDPHHPVTTTTAGIDGKLAKVINRRAPDIDFLSVQVYGGLFSLKDALKNIKWHRPLMITEWGTIGHWEVEKTSWGAPVELDSHGKAAIYVRGYQDVISQLDRRLIGNYVFLWSFKQERTPTWYGMFTPDGRKTEAVDVMQKIWTDDWPDNRVPILRTMTLDGQETGGNLRLKRGKSFPASVDVLDYESDQLSYEWVVMKESTATEAGGDKEQIPRKLDAIEGAGSDVTLVVPDEKGAYRLFVYVRDEKGVAHANIPFYSR